jgi:hypothetical protein
MTAMKITAEAHEIRPVLLGYVPVEEAGLSAQSVSDERPEQHREGASPEECRERPVSCLGLDRADCPRRA